MLQLIRDNAQGIVIWVIVGLIILAFASFGLSSYLGGSVKDTVVTINGQDIPRNVYQREYQTTLQRLQTQLGEQFRPDLFDENMLRDSVIQRLINQRLFSQFLDEAGFAASDQLVLQRLQQISLFQDDSGRFSPALYNEFLSQRRTSATQFEQSLASEVIATQFQSGVQKSAFVTDTYLQEYLRLLTQSRDVGVLTVSQSAYRDAEISEQAIEGYYRNNADAFMTEPKVKVNYIDLSLEKVARRFDFTERELKNYYQTHEAEFKSVNHAAARQRLQRIRQRLEEGAEFADLARQHSQDPGSAQQGGDLGYIAPGVMEKSFDEAIRKLDEGAVSDIVKTASGYHLIKVEDIKEEGGVTSRRVRHILIEPKTELKPFEQVRDEIKRRMQREEAENVYFEEANQLSNIAYEQPNSLQPAADALGVKLQQSDFYTRSTAKGVLANPQAKQVAFSQQAISEGRNSDPIEISDTHMLVLRVVDHQPARQKPLAEVKNTVRQRLRDENARQAALEAARQGAQAIQTGHSPEAVSNEIEGAVWQRFGYIGREPKYDAAKSEAPLSAQLRSAVFALAPAAGDAPRVKVNQRPNGDATVLVLYDVKNGDAQLPEGEAATHKRRLIQARINEAQGGIITYMRNTGDVTIHLAEEDK